MSKKNGLIGNAPGARNCTTTAAPSSTVATSSRTAM